MTPRVRSLNSENSLLPIGAPGKVYLYRNGNTFADLFSHKLARTAIELNPSLSEAYAELGYNIIRKRDFDAATAAVERAIALNPTFADYRLAQVFFSAGEPAKAIAIAKMQMRLDPFHPHFAPLMAGVAHCHLREYHDAQHWLSKRLAAHPITSMAMPSWPRPTLSWDDWKMLMQRQLRFCA